MNPIIFFCFLVINHFSVTEGQHESDDDLEHSLLKTFDDYIKLSTPTNFTNQNKVHVDIDINLKEYNDFHIYGIYTDSLGEKTLFYQYSFQDSIGLTSTADWKGSIPLIIPIPNDVVYFNHQNVKFPTNYFVNKIELKAKLVLLDITDKNIVTSVDEEAVNITLPNPWDRLHSQEYCLSWHFYFTQYVNNKTIPKCKALQDPNTFPGILPISGYSNGGFIRKLEEAKWPEHVPQHYIDKMKSTAKYTISFWVFLTSKCHENACFILQQRNATHFQGLLVILNDRGGLHIQLHDKHGSGEAFTTGELPLFTWISITLSVNNNHAQLYVYQKGNTQQLSFAGHFNFAYDGNNSLWAVGGYYVTSGFSGYLAKMRVIAHASLNPHHHHLQFVRFYAQAEIKELDALISGNDYRNCYTYQKMFKEMFYKDVGDGQSFSFPFLPLSHGFCLAEKKRKNWTETQTNVYEELLKVKTQIGGGFPLREEFSSFLHDLVLKNMTKKVASPQLLIPLLEVAGCLGHSKSFFALATFYEYGVAVKVNHEKAYKYHLMASQKANELSLLALAYRYQLAHVGLKQDIGLQAGLARQAAVITKQFLDSEKYEINTQSELVRLDQAHSMKDTRGESSELFKWLSRQASMGSTEAKNQIADMLLYGKQGVDANPAQAMEHLQDLAQVGDPAAMVNLAVVHLKGLNNMEKNITTAKKWLEKSVEKNSSLAFNVLGFIEAHHNQNVTAAIEYWKKGVDGGDVQSMYNYASVMEQINQTESVIYYQRAALLGERHSCFRLADLLMEGVMLQRNEQQALSFYQYIAVQNENIGKFMRNAINSYLDGDRYSSFLYHLLALESGLQLAGYNIALLLKEVKYEQADVVRHFASVNEPIHYINLTAELGWSTSLKEMGDHSLAVEHDTKKASLYYSRAIQNNNHPEALYNLAYMVEYSLPLDKALAINNLSLPWQTDGNLSLASELLNSCMASDTEGGEGYFPCQLALYKIQWKTFLRNNIFTYIPYQGEWLYLFYMVVLIFLVSGCYGVANMVT